jgi:hypothetical protein
MSRWLPITFVFFTLTTSAAFAQEWVGFANNTSALDREADLKAHCGPFRRVTVAGKASSFNALCESIGKKCIRVCDWGGTTKSCSEDSRPGPNGSRVQGRDGSRVAFCGAQASAPPPPLAQPNQQCTCLGATRSTNQVSCKSPSGQEVKKTQVCWTKKVLGTSTACGTVCDSVFTVCDGTASGQCR